jgi:hypothetical protein
MATLDTEFARTRSDISNLAKTIGNLSQRRVTEGVEYLRRAGEQVHAAAAETNALTNAGLQAAGRQITTRPVACLLAAFATGLLLGRLTDRR